MWKVEFGHPILDQRSGIGSIPVDVKFMAKWHGERFSLITSVLFRHMKTDLAGKKRTEMRAIFIRIRIETSHVLF